MVHSTSPSGGDEAGAVRNQFDEQSGLAVPRGVVRLRGRVDLPRLEPPLEEPNLHSVDHLGHVLVADPLLRSFLRRCLETFPEVPQRSRVAPGGERHSQLLRGSRTLAGRGGLGIGSSFGSSDSSSKADAQWLFVGRPVKLLDGTTVIMPDTEANQAVYPQSRSQKPGLGFPIARILLIISLAVGTVLEAAMGPYQGKQSSELGLFRQISGQLQPGDIALADRFFCNYWVIADSQRRRRRRRFPAAPDSQGRLPPGTSAGTG